MEENYSYNENNYFNAFRIFLNSAQAISYFDTLSPYIEEVYNENCCGPRVMNSLIAEYRLLYKSMGLKDSEIVKISEQLEEPAMNRYMDNLTDMGTLWYDNLIRSIRERLCAEEPSKDLWKSLRTGDGVYLENPFLGVIFDYEKLNTPGKMIMGQAGLSSTTYYPFLTIDPARLKDFNTRITATRELITDLIKHPTTGVSYIFWALLILTVDHNDYEQHLSEICNLADIIGMHEIVILDLMDIINAIYRRVAPEKVKLRSYTTNYVFQNVLGMYGMRAR